MNADEYTDPGTRVWESHEPVETLLVWTIGANLADAGIPYRVSCDYWSQIACTLPSDDGRAA